MSDRDYLYGYVCQHGSLARSCQVCDLEDDVCDLEDEVRRLRAGIAAHRSEVLDDTGKAEEDMLPADSRLWDLIGDDRE